MKMKTFVLSTLLVAATLPVAAQTTEPLTAAPPVAVEEKTPFIQRMFFGGGIGAAFGTVDYVSISPLVGFHVVPRLDLGIQPFYSWTKDGRYSPSVSTTDYGAGVFARVPIYRGLFAEADYQYASYEYAAAGGGSTRDAQDAVLAGAGYTLGAGRNVGIYFLALYDFTYNANDLYHAYDSPVRFQIGVSVGF